MCPPHPRLCKFLCGNLLRPKEVPFGTQLVLTAATAPWEPFNPCQEQGRGTETGTQLVLTAATAPLVSSYPCQEQREKHPAGRCTTC